MFQRQTSMNTLNHRVGDSQRDVPAFVPRISFPKDDHAWLILEKVADLVCAQIPHLGDLGNSVMPFNRGSVLNLRTEAIAMYVVLLTTRT